MDAASLSPGKKICKFRNLIKLKKNDENNASFTSSKKIKLETIDALEYNFQKSCLVYTKKLDDMHIFKEDMESVTMQKLLDNILIESLPRLENLRPYICPSFRQQKKKYKEMVNTFEIIKQKSLFLRDLVYKSELNTDYVEKHNKDTSKSLSDMWIKSELDTNDNDSNPLKSPSEICIKSELDTDDEAKDNLDPFKSPLDIDMKSQPIINDEQKHYSSTTKSPSGELETDDAKDNLDALTSITQPPGFSNIINVKSEYDNYEEMTSESILLSEIADATILSKNNTKHISSNVKQCEKIKELLKLCKPVRVSLTDYKKNLIPVSQEISSDDDDLPLKKTRAKQTTCQERNNESHHQPKLPTRNNPQYLGAFKQFIKLSNVIEKPKRYPSLSRKIHHRTTTKRVIVILNKYSNDVDIYCMNKKGSLVDYHKTTKNNAEEVLTGFPENTSPRKEICCWYKREEFIRTLGSKFIDVAAQRFMRKPHICLPGECTCCCKKDNLNRVEKLNSGLIVNRPLTLEDKIDLENEISNSIIQVEIKAKKSASKSTSKIFKGSLTKQSKLLSTLMDETIVFTKEKTQTNNSLLKVVDNFNCMRNKLIIINIVPEGQRECYELGLNGQVILYLKWYTSSPHNSLAQKLTVLKTPRITKPVCCWVQREATISKWINLGLVRNIANFIRSPHTCPGSKCLCCCSKKALNNTTKLKSLVGINLPIRASHSKRNIYSTTNKHTYIIENVPMFYENKQNATLTKYCLNNPKKISQLSPSHTINNITKNDNCTKTYKIDLTELIKRNPEKIIDTPEVPAGVDSFCVQQCINTILDTFQGVRLTINNDGKVAAALNTPVTSLSTSELKVLASIISCAQNEFDALGAQVISGTNIADTLLTTTKAVLSPDVISGTKATETSSPPKEAVQAPGEFPGTKIAKTNLNATKSVQTPNIQPNDGSMAIISNSIPGETSYNQLIANNSSINLIHKPSKPTPLSSTSNATNELTLKCTPKPNKTLLEPFANYLVMKKQNFQESFLSYFGNSEVNDLPTPIIQNVFSLQCTDASSSWHSQTNNTTEMNELNKEKTSNSNQILDLISQTNKVKTYQRKRKTLEDHPESQKKIKPLPAQPTPNTGVSTLQNLEPGTLNRNENIFTEHATTAPPTSSVSVKSFTQQPNILTSTHSDITINNISNALTVIPPTYQPTQGRIMSVILSDTNKQNFVTLDSMTTSPPQAVGFVAPAPIIPVNGQTMLLVAPLMLAQPPLTVVPYNDNKIILESVISAKNTMDSQITTVSELDPTVKSEIEILDKGLEEVVETFDDVKEEECILGV